MCVTCFLLDDSGQLVEKMSVRQFGLASLQAALREGSEIYLRGADKVVLTTPDLLEGQVLNSAAAAELSGSNWQVAETSPELLPGNGSFWTFMLRDFLGPLPVCSMT